MQLLSNSRKVFFKEMPCDQIPRRNEGGAGSTRALAVAGKCVLGVLCSWGGLRDPRTSREDIQEAVGCWFTRDLTVTLQASCFILDEKTLEECESSSDTF